MSGFIVSGGSLLEIGCPSELQRETQQQVSTTRTLGGRVKAFVRKGGRRVWSLNVGVATPSDLSTIEAVARNVGEVGWYGPDAVIGNLLSPQASGFDVTPADATDSGLAQLPDGTVARTVVSSIAVRLGNAHGNYEMVPVRAGSPVTVGAWSVGGQYFRGFWRDANGESITNWSDEELTWGGWQWHEVTLTPPSGAAFIELHLAGGSQYALPSVSWGTTAERAIGSGCPKAIVYSPSVSALALWPGTNVSAVAYSITEVG